MDISRVLGHLREIHDAPDEGRDFPEAFDGFDFSSKPAVAREIGVLNGGLPTAREPSRPLRHDLVYRSEPVEAYRPYDGTGGQMMLAAFGGPGPALTGAATARGGGYLEPPSRKAIIAQDGAEPRITVAPNPSANRKAPLHELPIFSEVKANNKHIDEMASKYRLDPDLIRSIMQMETTHGWYDRFKPWKKKSLRPMNVNTAYWKDRWARSKT